MANTKISALSSASTPLTGSEIVPINQSGVTDSVSVANLTAGRNVVTGTVVAGPNAKQSLNSLEVNANTSYAGFIQNTGYGVGGTPINPNLNYGFYVGFNRSNGNAESNLIWGSGVGGSSDLVVAQWDGTNYTVHTTFKKSGDLNLSAGNVVQGTAGKGINFTANTPASGMTSQNLTWYEEGTWTPTGNGVTLASASGTYVRIGKSVTVFLDITMPVTANTSQCSFGGLPFTVGKSGGLSIGYTTNTNAVTFNAGTSGTTLNGYLLGGTALSNATYSGARIIGSCTYSV